jgi:hypothetical protein
MKKIFTIFAAALMTASMFLPQQVAAQAPEKMSYQAVIHNSSDELVKNSQIGMQISILQGSASGTAVYVETQIPTTNVNGLVSIEIGGGTVVTGDFTTIDWGSNLYFIKTEIDPSGGTNYTISGTTQLLSVPYALYAKHTKAYKVGDFAHGGIVFWVDATGQHGLVCAKSDQSTGIRWSVETSTRTMARANGPKAGFMNTAIIIVNEGYGDGNTYAARLCNESQITEEGKTYADWYLPSKEELFLMYQNKAIVDSTAVAHGGNSLTLTYYWSSTEYDSGSAWYFNFSNAATFFISKSDSLYVRAVRAF